ncbi:MAG TPA: epoxide hydrolase [Sphingopyxis sp.]|uniref:epoxide hydrolase family protein n=1 Tax=Sphingopyxis sp. TaxID=1908224 RepID=UPI002C9580FC|nr:epoxide hydrolase [Sphingopyxis sp.]HWW56284.1 epoxide hydrolase [Sphingopyxis sp.]
MSVFDIKPFSLTVAEDVLVDLRHRLRATRWPDEVSAAAWQYGPPVSYMQDIVRYWLDRYDWRQQEARINGFHQYITEIDELAVHFIHERGVGPDPMPLVLTHGWPGSFVEMLRIIPILTDPVAHGGRAEDAFTVIVPSIPGHGFSGRPTRPGMNYSVVADMWATLMERLGYRRFGTQGGDWGAWVSAALALQYPDRICGLHLNYLSTRFRPGISSSDRPVSDEEQGYLDRVGKWAEAEGAYIAIQSTKPLTLAYGLTDSPAGLAAWLLEKFRSWSDCVSVPQEAIALDELLTDVMVYWVTGTAHSAARFYSESRERPFHLAAGEKILPPCGVVTLPRELPMPPRSWAERAFNIVHWTSLPRGGHFAAFEQPELLADDIRTFFRPLRKRSVA